MALTIADAFKVAYENYEKGKNAKNPGSSRVAQEDSKENAQQALPVVKNGNADIYAAPAKATAPLDAPIIQVTSDSSSSVVEDSGRKIQALVIQPFILLESVNAFTLVDRHFEFDCLYITALEGGGGGGGGALSRYSNIIY